MSRQPSLHIPALTLDMKQRLIRIHKTTIDSLNSPEYVQLLVNPKKRTIVVMCSSKKDHLAHKVPYERLCSGKCFTLYSTYLLKKLTSISGESNPDASYRIYGEHNPELNIVRFSLDNLVENVKERNIHES